MKKTVSRYPNQTHGGLSLKAVQRVQRAFCRSIRRLRAKKHYTQEKVAELLGISHGYYTRIENGVHFPSVRILDHLLDVFSCQPFELFLGERLEQMTASMEQSYQDTISAQARTIVQMTAAIKSLNDEAERLRAEIQNFRKKNKTKR